jgi:hypothetical protein
MATDFRALTDLSQVIAKRGTDSPPTTERGYYAHCLFVKASMHAWSIVSLCDSALERDEQADVSGICVLARCLIEVRNAAAHLLESNISKDEAHLRLHLVGLNQSGDMQRVNKGLQTSRTDFWTEHSITYSREELAKNPSFLALEPDHRKHLLRGKSPYLHSRYRGARPLSIAQESAIYTLLSHSAHAFALGLSGFAGYGRATPAGTLNSFRIATLAAQIYLADTAKTYCKFRRRALGKLKEDESALLEKSSDPVAMNTLLKGIHAAALQ